MPYSHGMDTYISRMPWFRRLLPLVALVVLGAALFVLSGAYSSLPDLDDLVLAGLNDYGVWALGLATLVAALGVPLPSSMLLLAAGAFARQGVLNWQWALALAAVGAIAGDSGSYLIGRFGARFAPWRAQSTPAWQRAQTTFAHWGGMAVFLSRFLLMPLALPINLMAGSTEYAPARYLGLVAAGETIWVLGFGGMGYLFASSWQNISALAGQVSGWAVASAVVLAGGAFLVRRLRLAGFRPAPLVAATR